MWCALCSGAASGLLRCSGVSAAMGEWKAGDEGRSPATPLLGWFLVLVEVLEGGAAFAGACPRLPNWPFKKRKTSTFLRTLLSPAGPMNPWQQTAVLSQLQLCYVIIRSGANIIENKLWRWEGQSAYLAGERDPNRAVVRTERCTSESPRICAHQANLERLVRQPLSGQGRGEGAARYEWILPSSLPSWNADHLARLPLFRLATLLLSHLWQEMALSSSLDFHRTQCLS